MSSLSNPSPFRGSRKMLFFLALTGGLGGLQGVFSVQTAMGSPYLMSLGLSKPVISFVWLAGPLAGVIGQPYFGICSDQCRISWGRRKTFIAGGALVIAIALPALAWTGEIVHTFAWIASERQDFHVLHMIIKTTATILIWVLNFAIQPLQCGLRALIVEICPPEDMDTANAWASRMISIGSLLGYGSGLVDLSQLMHIGGAHAQFKALAVLATCSLIVAVVGCCCGIRERDPNEDGPPSGELGSMLAKFKHIYGSISRIPPQVAMVCKVQLCSWLGWFSFMYYITTYIGEVYLRDIRPVDAAVQKEANRYGSLALLLFAFFQLLASIVAPHLIAMPKYDLQPNSATSVARTTVLLPRFLARQFTTSWSSLCSLWILSHTIFATCMFSTLFISRSVVGATVIVGFVGISAALSQIVPFTLISLILSRYHEQAIFRSFTSPAINEITAEKSATHYEIQPGIVMGIHNMSIAAPQLVAAVGSSAIFLLLGTNGQSGDESKSTAWVLRAGGLAAVAAVYMTLKLRQAS